MSQATIVSDVAARLTAALTLTDSLYSRGCRRTLEICADGATMRETGLRLVAYPKSGDPYTRSFNAALESEGVEVTAGDFSARRIMTDIIPGSWAHLHWPSFEYFEPGRAGWRNAIAAARFTFLLLLIRARGGRVVWTAHNLYPHDGGRTPLHRYARWLVTTLAEVVVAHGERASCLVQAELAVPARRIVSVLCGSWHGEFANDLSREAARARLNVAPDQWVYGFVGQIKAYKGVDSLIRAFASIPDPQSRLIIAGKFQSAEYRDEVRALVASDARIRLDEGFVPDEDLQCYFKASDCAVLPYRTVLTSGNVNLAISFGCPVVAPAIGAIPDHLPDWAGVLYEPNGVRSVRDAMLAARSRAFDRDAIARHAATHTWQRAAHTVRERLERLANT